MSQEQEQKQEQQQNRSYDRRVPRGQKRDAYR